MNKRVLRITVFYIILLVSIFVIDYFNMFSFVTLKLNYNYLSIFIGTLTTIYLFLVTYYLIDKRISDNEKEKKLNKENALYIMLNETYSACKDTVELYAKNSQLMEYIVKKIDFDDINNPFLENQKTYPFKYDYKILDLVSDGMVDRKILEQYISVKNKFSQYTNAKFTLFALKAKKNVSNDEVKDMIESIAFIEKEFISELDGAIESVNINLENIKKR